METLFYGGGRSARRRPTKKISLGYLFACALGILNIILALLMASCSSETRGQTADLKTMQADTVKPKVDIKVNRRFDKDGNMIGFDSTYTSYYSNVIGDTTRMDSLMGSFDRFFRMDHSSFFRNQFDPLFFNDSSTRYPDFFHSDYFLKRYEMNDAYMRGMMHRMDSIKNSFYREHRKSDKEEKLKHDLG